MFADPFIDYFDWTWGLTQNFFTSLIGGFDFLFFDHIYFVLSNFLGEKVCLVVMTMFFYHPHVSHMLTIALTIVNAN